MGGKYPLSGCSLEYRFVDVQDEETDGKRIMYLCLTIIITVQLCLGGSLKQ
jgi:hypothetical protein